MEKVLSRTPPVDQTSEIVVGAHHSDPPRGNFWWRGAALDDLHVSSVARYSQNFVPLSIEPDENSVLMWRFSEGAGDTTRDEVAQLELALSGPTWVEGR